MFSWEFKNLFIPDRTTIKRENALFSWHPHGPYHLLLHHLFWPLKTCFCCTIGFITQKRRKANKRKNFPSSSDHFFFLQKIVLEYTISLSYCPFKRNFSNNMKHNRLFTVFRSSEWTETVYILSLHLLHFHLSASRFYLVDSKFSTALCSSIAKPRSKFLRLENTEARFLSFKQDMQITMWSIWIKTNNLKWFCQSSILPMIDRRCFRPLPHSN